MENVKQKHKSWKMGESGLLLFIYTTTHFSLRELFLASKLILFYNEWKLQVGPTT